MTELKTDRLVLRNLQRKDLPLLVTLIGEWDVAKWLSRVPYPYTMDDAEKWLEIVARQELNLSIFRDSVLIGGVGLTREPDGSHELGYWLAKECWGKGYATESARALLQHATRGPGVSQIKSGYMAGNVSSAHVLAKLDFTVVGDIELYSLARQEKVICTRLVLNS